MFAKSSFRMLVAGAAMMLGLVLSTARADTLHLKDGKTIEGTVVKEENGMVWFKATVGGQNAAGKKKG